MTTRSWSPCWMACSPSQIADSLGFQNQANKLLQERLWHIQVCNFRRTSAEYFSCSLRLSPGTLIVVALQSCSATTGDGLKDVGCPMDCASTSSAWGGDLSGPFGRQGMDWLVEKVKTPIQRDAEFYYTRAAEGR